MRVAGQPRTARGAPVGRNGHRVAAGAAEPEQQSGEALRRDIFATAQTRQRRGAVLNQPGPDVRPVGAARQAQQPHPQEPIDIGGGQPGDAEHIGDGPGFRPDAKEAKLERRRGSAGEVVIDAGDKPLDPVERCFGQSLFDRRHGAGRVEQPQRVIKRDRDRAENFGQAALRDAAQQLHLGQAQMRMDEAERHRQIAIAVRLDERNEPIVPADLDGCADRQVEPRQGGEPLRDSLWTGPVAQTGPSQPPRQRRNRGDCC